VILTPFSDLQGGVTDDGGVDLQEGVTANDGNCLQEAVTVDKIGEYLPAPVLQIPHQPAPVLQVPYQPALVLQIPDQPAPPSSNQPASTRFAPPDSRPVVPAPRGLRSLPSSFSISPSLRNIGSDAMQIFLRSELILTATVMSLISF
jgi:hypothetical protein